jgi:hypothetical protein
MTVGMGRVLGTFRIGTAVVEIRLFPVEGFVQCVCVVEPGAAAQPVAALATGASWVCYFRALQVGEASKVAPVDKLSVAFVIVFAWLLLGEPMTWRVCLGGSLVVAGALVLATS